MKFRLLIGLLFFLNSIVHAGTIAGGSAGTDPGAEAEETLSMFRGDLFENFRNFSRYGKTSVIERDKVRPLPRAYRNIEFSADFLGEKIGLEQFLELSNTSAFLVLKDGVLIYERYLHGDSVESRHMSFSVAKSFVSALVGAAIADGLIDSIDDPIQQYLPELDSDTFKGVTIKHILQMSSGVRFNEDYTDPNSDINKMVSVVQKTSYLDYINTLDRQYSPGTFNHYASVNPQLLGILLVRVTGKTLTEYTSEKLWKPLGMEQTGFWRIDEQGIELAMGGMAATARDYARLGLLYLNKGRVANKQVLPSKWVQDSVIPNEPHLMPGNNPRSSSNFGYQYQWWMPIEYDGDFMARGIWGQTVYVHPGNGVVIVKLAADAKNFQANYKLAYIEYIQDLAQALGN